MPASALEAAPVIEIESKIPDGGGPGNEGFGGGGEGGGEPDDWARRAALYRLGVILLVASIVPLFAGLAIAFWVRSHTAFLWQPVDPPRSLWLSTAILVASSVTLEMSRNSLGRQMWFAYRRRLVLTVYLGLAFLACQLAALVQLVREGLYFRGNPHTSAFYVFTGLHGLHLIGGMLALSYLLFLRGQRWKQHTVIASATSIYWHFMGVLWIALFVVLLRW